jgi:hypothetical protein
VKTKVSGGEVTEVGGQWRGIVVKKTAKVRERRVEIKARGGEVTKNKMKESAEVMKWRVDEMKKDAGQEPKTEVVK